MKEEINAGVLLREASDLYSERNAIYGSNYKRVGAAVAALFPDGVKLDSEEAFNRWHIFELIVVKLSRWAVAVERGGSHKDSLKDLAVYAAILEEIDTNAGFFDKMRLTPLGQITRAWEKSTVAKREDLPVKESL